VFFVTDRSVLEAGDVVVLSGAEGRHAAVVRRLRPGERIDVGDGAGLVAECVVTRVSGSELGLAVTSRREVPRPSPVVTVIQAIPKGDRGELAVEEMTEVGVDRIIPWAAERSVPIWRGSGPGGSGGSGSGPGGSGSGPGGSGSGPGGASNKGAGRWRAKAREAAKQAERAWIPEVTDPVTTAEAAKLIQAAVRGAAVRGAAVRGAGVCGAGGLAVLLDPGAEHPLAAVRPPTDGELIAVVGPEGGISAEEHAALTAAGARAYRLGPSVLRTSTAGAVAAAVLLSRTARWA
jgi:16S rRNA (uracil1498-N3)-methyltransferase